MAKAILVLDKMPMDCEDCQLSYRNAYAGVRCCTIEKSVGSTWNDVANGERYELCPLQALPKPIDFKHRGGTITEDYANGFNDCLTLIAGTEDLDGTINKARW